MLMQIQRLYTADFLHCGIKDFQENSHSLIWDTWKIPGNNNHVFQVLTTMIISVWERSLQQNCVTSWYYKYFFADFYCFSGVLSIIWSLKKVNITFVIKIEYSAYLI